MTRLIVGLGNPGPDYEGTRHNVGFEVVDHLARHEGLLFQTASRIDGYAGERAFSAARSFDPDAYLLKPETFMNRSGNAVVAFARWAEVEPKDILVVYDDLDLDVARLRLRPHGGSGGQRGVASIVEKLGTNQFPRLRVGVGRPTTDAARYVLDRFPPREREVIDVAIAEACEALIFWLQRGDIEQCMTRFHSRWNQG